MELDVDKSYYAVPLLKENIVNSSQKVDINLFLSCLALFDCFNLFQNVLHMIVPKNKFLPKMCSRLFPTILN